MILGEAELYIGIDKKDRPRNKKKILVKKGLPFGFGFAFGQAKGTGGGKLSLLLTFILDVTSL